MGRAHAHALVGVHDRAQHSHQRRGVLDDAARELVGRLAQAQALGVGSSGASADEQRFVGVGGPQAQVDVQAVAGLVGEGLGHERRVAAVALGQGVHHQPEQDEPVGGGKGVGVLPVLLVLPVGVLVVVGIVAPSHGVEVLGHRGQMRQHPGEALGVVAGQRHVVAVVGHRNRAVVAAHNQRVLGLHAALEHDVALSDRLQRPAQDHSRRVGPQLALHRRVALHGGHVRLPGQLRVGRRVGQGEYVGAGRILAYRAGREPREPGPVTHQPLQGADGYELGARLAVHLHEHGVDELHAVGLHPAADLVECVHVVLPVVVPSSAGSRRPRVVNDHLIGELGLRGRADRRHFTPNLARCRARPWPERPVSAANKSGNATPNREALTTYPRMF